MSAMPPIGDSLNSSSNDGTFNLVRILCKQRSGINICHLNAQSLKNKMDEFRNIFEKSGVDVICVSETWFNDEVFKGIIELQGFQMFHCDRYTHGGGVAVFIKSGITCKFVTKSEYNERVEHLFVEIISMGSKLLVGCVYRPNKRICLEDFQEKLVTLTVSYENVVICGDFNSNLLNESYLIDAMEAMALSPTNTTTPTHFTSTSQTLLDVFFVNSKSKVLLYDQISAPCFSKHDLIFLCYDFSPQRNKEETLFYDFKRMDYNIMGIELANVDWNCIFFTPDIDCQVNFLQTQLYNIFQKTVPLKKTLMW